MLERSSFPGSGRGGRRGWSALSISFGVHAVMAGSLLAAGYLAIGTIHPPDAVLIIVPPPPPPAAPPPPPKGMPRPARAERKEAPVKQLPEMLQPEPPAGEAPEPVSEEPEQAGEGVPWGDEEGEIGGISGGLCGGLHGGTLGGLPFVPPGAPAPPEIQDEEEPIRLVGDVRPPERILYVEPEYPEIARKSRVEGRVVLEIVVGREGDVERVTVLKGSALLNRAAADAARRWRYRPALQSGRPVKVYLTVIVDFSLR